MAIYKENIVDIDLAKGKIHRQFLAHSIGSGDNGADRFGIRVFRNREEVDLSGCSCYGYFLDPQGNPVALTSYGTVDGNVAYVTLPQACYNYEGQFTLSIKLLGGGVTGTMRIVDGVVDNTHTGGAVAPTGAVPTYSEILSQYDAMVAATAAANSAIAPTFDATKAYTAGQYVINDGSLYRLTADHAANTTWANTSKVEVKFGNELTDEKNTVAKNTGAVELTGWLYNKRVRTDSDPVNLTPASTTTGYYCMVVDCVEGDKFTLTGTSSNTNYRLFCWCNNDGTRISPIAPSGSSYKDKIITAPEGATKLIVNNSSGEHYLFKGETDAGKHNESVATMTANAEAIAAIKEHAFMLRTGYAVTIENGTDYNTLTTPGNYRVSSTISVATMINCPIASSHRLIVLTTSTTESIFQIIFANNNRFPAMYIRYFNTSWTPWARILNTENNHEYPSYIDTEADRVAKKVRDVQTGDSLTFIAVSDMHYNADDAVVQRALLDMANGIKVIAGQTHIDFYMSFGDEIYRLSSNGDFSKGKTEMIEMTKLLNACFGNNDQIRLIGNHDPNAEGATGYFTANQLNAYTGIYSNIISRFETFPYGGIGYCDFERQKIRLISLDTSLYEQAGTPDQGSTQYSFGSRQAHWLCQKLDLTDKEDAADWQIIVTSHVNIDVTEHASTIGKHSAVFAAYESGGTWSVSGYSYNFSGKNVAKLALYINGHWHHYRAKNVRNVNSSGTVLANLSMANLYVPNALPDRDYESMDGVTYTKTAESAESTAFQVITIDPTNKIVYAHHYGAGVDIILHYEAESVNAAKTFTTGLASPAWSINDSSIATVSNGVVTPVANGNTMVFAKSTSNNCIEVWNLSVAAT